MFTPWTSGAGETDTIPGMEASRVEEEDADDDDEEEEEAEEASKAPSSISRILEILVPSFLTSARLLAANDPAIPPAPRTHSAAKSAIRFLLVLNFLR